MTTSDAHRWRPRLARYVAARRHVSNSDTAVVLHDLRTDQVLLVGEREWTVLRCADGTRDMEGIVAAAARRGRAARSEHLMSFFADLDARELLTDGIHVSDEEAAFERDGAPPQAVTADELDGLREKWCSRPLDGPSWYALACDGSGACCSMFSTVVFSPVEAAAARALCPEVLDGAHTGELAFTPERSAAFDGEGSARGVRAVSLVDGRCAYLGEDRLCRIHARGGEDLKPLGCNLFPRDFVDDGEAIRVSVAPVCACVFTSPDDTGGEPLVPRGMRIGEDLDPRVHVRQLPEQVELGAGRRVARSELVQWSRELVGALEERRDVSSGASICLALAGAIERSGLTGASLVGADVDETIDGTAIAPSLSALRATAESRSALLREYRGERDLVRCTTRWVNEACDLLVGDGVEQVVGRSPSTGRDEWLSLVMAVHGHQLIDGRPLAVSLRDRAVRLMVARALPLVADASDLGKEAQRSLDHPISLVEALVRGWGREA